MAEHVGRNCVEQLCEVLCDRTCRGTCVAELVGNLAELVWGRLCEGTVWRGSDLVGGPAAWSLVVEEEQEPEPGEQ